MIRHSSVLVAAALSLLASSAAAQERPTRVPHEANVPSDLDSRDVRAAVNTDFGRVLWLDDEGRGDLVCARYEDGNTACLYERVPQRFVGPVAITSGFVLVLGGFFVTMLEAISIWPGAGGVERSAADTALVASGTIGAAGGLALVLFGVDRTSRHRSAMRWLADRRASLSPSVLRLDDRTFTTLSLSLRF